MTEDTYSDALRRLEIIVAELERGGMDLEATLERFEEGSKLLERCQAELKEAEGRLENLRLPEAEVSVFLVQGLQFSESTQCVQQQFATVHEPGRDRCFQ